MIDVEGPWLLVAPDDNLIFHRGDAGVKDSANTVSHQIIELYFNVCPNDLFFIGIL